jgi:hypothetical protein
MPRAAAAAAPVSANGAYAAHLEREGDRPISAVAATRKRNASMAEGGGPCKCTSSAYATTLTLGNVRWTFSRVSCRVRAKKRGPQGSPWWTPSWEERGGASEGDPRTTRNPWARYVQAAKGSSRGARQVTACNKACQETLLKAFWKSSCRVTSLGQQERPAQSAWPTPWLPPGMLTPSCRGARAGPVSGQARCRGRLLRRRGWRGGAIPSLWQ